MQLPRGQFHRLIKSTTSRALIEEMGSVRFTGICTIVIGSESATLVLNEGLVVLAEYGGIKGQHALDEALKGGESEAAAELNLLTPEQIQLALEFNRPFKTGDLDTKKERRPSPGKAAPKTTGAKTVPTRRPEPPAEVHRLPMPGVKPVQETTAAPQSGSEEIDTLVRNMEEMDVEQLVGSFRVNCKDMLRRIHLDHLIQDKDT
ncbi:hypothetical protein [Methanoculleus sp. 7T]|jgi:hypothetical protein|uniref:hypothetical protein n=1 Tax=Methanoculleus sp. 7T TaxID=2937282 RepID=UPI0020C10BDF|nr:hypothetical protein [Methanoculleus sp. 7T]MCK8517486.1 hypothetical protein [Methanoculleus sp. 7T]